MSRKVKFKFVSIPSRYKRILMNLDYFLRKRHVLICDKPDEIPESAVRGY